MKSVDMKAILGISPPMEVGRRFTDLTTSIGGSVVTCTLLVTILKQITSYYFIIIIVFLTSLLFCATLFDYCTCAERLEIIKAKRYEEFIEVTKKTFDAETSSSNKANLARFHTLVLVNKKAKRTIDRWGIIQNTMIQNLPQCAVEKFIHDDQRALNAILSDHFPKLENNKLTMRARDLVVSAQTTALLVNHVSAEKARELVDATKAKVNETSRRMRKNMHKKANQVKFLSCICISTIK